MYKTSKIVVGIMALALLGGCMSSREESVPAWEAPLPEAWTAALSPDWVSDDTSADWLADFNDEQLSDLVSEAFEHNYDLKAAAARFEAASAVTTIAGAGRLPQVTLNGGGQRRKNNFIGFPSTASGGQGGGNTISSSTSNTFNLDLGLAWEIDIWGRIRDARAAALADLAASEELLNAAHLSLAVRVSEAWYSAIAAEMQVALAEETVTNFRDHQALIEDRYERGVISALDVRLSRANTASAEAVRASQQQERDVAVRSLEVLLGRYPSDELALASHLPDVLGAVPAGVPADVLTRRPDVLSAEHGLKAAAKRVGEAEKARLPRISLTASGGTSSEELRDVLSKSYSVWSLAGNLAQPLFEGGRLQAEVERTQAVWKEQQALYRKTVLQALREIESALSAEVFLNAREASLQVASEEASEAETLAWDRYQRGLEDIIAVLDSQRRAFDARRSLIDVRRERIRNRLNLYLALGGGFENDEA